MAAKAAVVPVALRPALSRSLPFQFQPQYGCVNTESPQRRHISVAAQSFAKRSPQGKRALLEQPRIKRIQGFPQDGAFCARLDIASPPSAIREKGAEKNQFCEKNVNYPRLKSRASDGSRPKSGYTFYFPVFPVLRNGWPLPL